MSLFEPTVKMCRELAVVIMADMDDELLAVRKIPDKTKRVIQFVTAQQRADENRLAGSF